MIIFQRTVLTDIPVPPTLSAPADESRTYIVPKGHTLLASPAVVQVDPTVWKDAQTWDPYRWTDPSGAAAQAQRQYDDGVKVDYGFGQVSKGTESTYQPFGAGRHRCIGETVRRYIAACVIMEANNALYSLRISNLEPSSRL